VPALTLACPCPTHTPTGGQKSRVAMARVTFSKPHILLLDEPSNHLDMDAVEALVEVGGWVGGWVGGCSGGPGGGG
jgi:ABC-type uncharacterized transport system YnjBCD ATPase subunit